MLQNFSAKLFMATKEAVRVFLRTRPVRSPSASLCVQEQEQKASFKLEKDSELGCGLVLQQVDRHTHRLPACLLCSAGNFAQTRMRRVVHNALMQYALRRIINNQREVLEFSFAGVFALDVQQEQARADRSICCYHDVVHVLDLNEIL